MMQIFKNVINKVKRKSAPRIVRILTSDDGLDVLWQEGRTEALKWSEVERVFTYKIDCFSYDMICLAFELHGRHEALHIQEEIEGFQNLMSALTKIFPEINPEWYFNVMQPAFAENLTVLFERKSQT